jgi:hypothetical protein
MRAACPVHLIFLDVITLFREEQKLWSSLCIFLQLPITYIEIFISAPRSQTKLQCIRLLGQEIKFHIHTKQLVQLGLWFIVCLHVFLVDWKAKDSELKGKLFPIVTHI